MSNTLPKPVVLISMDGVGVAAPGPGNAVTLANTPNLDKYWPAFPHTYLEASGVNVGLPSGTDGNSEVGHTTLGAGKILFQDLPRIDNAIKNGGFNNNPYLLEAINFVNTNNGKLHLIGLVGQGKVHSSVEHLYKLIELAKLARVNPDSLYIHAITDGRDSEPTAATDILQAIQDKCLSLKIGRIASVVGRFYAMDRDRRWDRTQGAYDLYTSGKGQITTDFKAVMQQTYKTGKTDEYVEPTVIQAKKDDSPILVQSGDAVIFFNYRADRAVQLTRAFIDETFIGFNRPNYTTNIKFVTFTQYADDLNQNVAFKPEVAEKFLGKAIAEAKRTQLRLAESEKFAHVTYFFNVGLRDPMPGEDWIEVPSPKEVMTYDEKPEMSMKWVTDVAVQKIDQGSYDFILVNFAGPDMVAHTGNIEASVKAMSICDECIGRIVEMTLNKNGAVIITADHGNAEEMLDLRTGELDTKHSVNQVPLIIIQKGLDGRELPIGNLADVAPTVLGLMGIQKPLEMTGRDLLI